MADDQAETGRRCVMDRQGFFTLHRIMESFSAPINEEQAWAMCYQLVKHLKSQWKQDPSNCWCVAGPEAVNVGHDGSVEIIKSSESQKAPSEHHLVESVGVMIFNALDYGLDGNEERSLSQPLEELISQMTCRDDSLSKSWHDDEGIEHDASDHDESDVHTSASLDDVIRICSMHLSSPTEEDAGSHYKAVCRALVAESVELSTFLAKVKSGTSVLHQMSKETDLDDSCLEEICIKDWAVLWMQVIRSLREGVKLKKVSFDNDDRKPIEYSLTPYEMLMDDIRSRRYKLREVSTTHPIPPNVTKDAHSLILEFIRSRPPLSPVSKRNLPPPPSAPTSPYDALMKSIKEEHHLRPVTPPPSSDYLTVETSRTRLLEGDPTPQVTRRRIKADLSLLLPDNLDDDDDIPLIGDDKSPAQPWQQAVAHDLATQESVTPPERRHSISVCESPTKSQPNSGRSSASSDNSEEGDTIAALSSSQWHSHFESLSLTMEEVMHIRSVLTKAQLETLLTNRKLYNDLSRGKVCFVCKKVRFSFLGQWGTTCKLCQRNVCGKCCKKMQVPTEHFGRIPVYALGPDTISGSSSGSSSGEDSPVKGYTNTNPFNFGINSVGSAPNSPSATRRSRRDQAANKHSKCLNGNANHVTRIGTSEARRRITMRRSKTTVKEPVASILKGPILNICRECKSMIVHIIKASNATLSSSKAISPFSAEKKRRMVTRQQSLSPNLRLNIKPIY